MIKKDKSVNKHNVRKIRRYASRKREEDIGNVIDNFAQELNNIPDTEGDIGKKIDGFAQELNNIPDSPPATDNGDNGSETPTPDPVNTNEQPESKQTKNTTDAEIEKEAEQIIFNNNRQDIRQDTGEIGSENNNQPRQPEVKKEEVKKEEETFKDRFKNKLNNFRSVMNPSLNMSDDDIARLHGDYTGKDRTELSNELKQINYKKAAYDKRISEIDKLIVEIDNKINVLKSKISEQKTFIRVNNSANGIKETTDEKTTRLNKIRDANENISGYEGEILRLELDKAKYEREKATYTTSIGKLDIKEASLISESNKLKTAIIKGKDKQSKKKYDDIKKLGGLIGGFGDKAINHSSKHLGGNIQWNDKALAKPLGGNVGDNWSRTFGNKTPGYNRTGRSITDIVTTGENSRGISLSNVTRLGKSPVDISSVKSSNGIASNFDMIIPMGGVKSNFSLETNNIAKYSIFKKPKPVEQPQPQYQQPQYQQPSPQYPSELMIPQQPQYQQPQQPQYQQPQQPQYRKKRSGAIPKIDINSNINNLNNNVSLNSIKNTNKKSKNGFDLISDINVSISGNRKRFASKGVINNLDVTITPKNDIANICKIESVFKNKKKSKNNMFELPSFKL